MASKLFRSLRVPIIQAPMAGASCPKLANAVARAGGVGSLAFGYSSPENVMDVLKEAKSQSISPLNANFFVVAPVSTPSENLLLQAKAALESLPCVSEPIPTPQFKQYKLEDQLEYVWTAKPELITFHFGLPSRDIIAKAHSCNILVGSTATCLEEATAGENIGVDFIVAQGIEAGGHRGKFSVDMQHDDMLDMRSLLSTLVGKIHIPIVAAGGIMQGRDVKEVLNAGAHAAQLGTVFLTSEESILPASAKRYLLEMRERHTTLTTVFSGRPARALRNEFVERMAGQSVLPYPFQNDLTSTVRKAAIAKNDGEYQSIYCGTKFRHCQVKSASEIVKEIDDYLASELWT